MIRIGSILQTNWDWRAAGNFMFGGTGSGMLLLLVIAFYPAAPPLLVELVALGLVGLGLFLVWLEIGRPWRAINVLFHPQTSWMTREAFVAMVTFGLALAGIVLQTPWIIAAAGIAGLGFLFCQGRILHASKGIPAWREPSIVALIMSTGLAEGAGALLALMILAGVQTPSWLAYTFITLLAVRVLAWGTYRGALAASNAPPAALAALAGVSRVFLLLGNVVPAAMIGLSIFFPQHINTLAVLAGIFAVLAGWNVKFTIITRAAQVQGYAFGKLQKGHPLAKKAA